jgi:hypothetical protein
MNFRILAPSNQTSFCILALRLYKLLQRFVQFIATVRSVLFTTNSSFGLYLFNLVDPGRRDGCWQLDWDNGRQTPFWPEARKLAQTFLPLHAQVERNLIWLPFCWSRAFGNRRQLQ